ncbi:MAG: prepilin-type N-terminal cleavage/methylation domain-containing protein, partial [Desulfobacteraceae bacterium]|nr:prepilin-type N-terminal cleavage/methylation domain-containing protein [Desulfobacteraceae bacterium]
MKYPNNKSGFTLIEILIALIITSMVIGAAANVFLNLQRTSTEIDQRTDLAA